jgi:hypothetical protein
MQPAHPQKYVCKYLKNGKWSFGMSEFAEFLAKNH